ncbi:amino acid adenylation domain-containing protein [Kitasatospora sp. NPDC056327]|uniref:amino acid adenylation domain-containing protein n=1 Tax=Kitasatospora sp. NPDC056327 TaxID=3345785 RepID=UPI0035DB8C82
MRQDERARTLLRILAEVLPGREVTLDRPLRELGLESLALTRVWFQLRREFGVDVPVSALARCTDPAEVLERVEEAAAGADAAAPPAAGPAGAGPGTPAPADTAAGGPADRYEPFPLTDLQQAYLVAKDPRLGDDPIGCHVYREFTVPGLDTAALEDAWNRVVRHHDMLRAEITPDGRQRVRERVEPVRLPVGPLAGAPEVRARLSHRQYRPGEWPMHAVEVSRDDDGQAVVHLSIDVLFIDGHGLGVVLDDWWHCYRDPRHALPEPRTTVRECLADLARQRRAPGYRADVEYWTERLAGLPDGPLPGGPATGGPATRTALTGRIDPDQWQVLRRLATAWEVSPTALVLTVFAETFGRQRERRPRSLVLTTNDRSRLPAEADDLVGPFTSSLVLPLPDTLDRTLPEAAREVHRLLLDGLDHASVSGVAALRALRAADRSAPAPVLPVVFTSLLGSGRAGADGFAGAVGHALSQTTGVALDHQMWEQDGALRLRWDVFAARFATGEAEVLFAAFVNALAGLGDRPAGRRPMNELQQAYFVPRAVTGPGDWDGCQVHHSFEVDGLDTGRLEAAWLTLVRTYDVLRTVVTREGRLEVDPHVPSQWAIPVIDLAVAERPADVLADLARRMAGRALPLGRGPQSELCVTLAADGAATVHLTTDLTVLDGRSIHFLVRELFRHYADPDAEPVATDGYEAYAAGREALRGTPEWTARTGHWRARVAALHAGPAVAPAAGPRTRRRLEGLLTGWRSVRERAERAGLTPDDLLAAACTEALARHYPVPFSLPVVRWTEGSRPYRPGEYTALSWVSREDAGLGLWEQAAAFREVVAADEEADGVSGLGELRRRVMRERRTGAFELPVVYTGLLDLSGQQLPEGVRLGPWLTCTPDVALDCIAIDEGDELRFYWDADAERFAPGWLDGMFAHYRELLTGLAGSGAAAGPGSASDAASGSARVSGAGAVVGDDRQVQLLFQDRAAETPDAVAVRWAGGTLTYGGLNRWANRIAWALREQGVGPGTPVGISVRRGPAMAAAVHGVLKAGGFYVPVEPSLPGARAAAILRDARVGLLLTDEDPTGPPPPGDVRTLAVTAAGRPEHDPEPVGTVDDLAYVIFTSGSTGAPKGVEVSHRPLLNLLRWCARTHGFGPQDVGLCVTSLGFDLSVFDLLGLLGYGASLYIADEAEQRDPQLLLDVLLREPVTFWNSAPTTLAQLAPLFPTRAGRPGTDTLRLVYLSGDFTPLPLPDQVRALFPRARIVSLGGATEATVWSNWFEVGTVDPSWRSIPYGRPIDNAVYHILDERLRPCPPGVEGDLFIGGDCLSLGYHRRPELTAERFVEDPFADRDGALMYRTGDRASFFEDGVISFHGRADGQVKVRGFRVELPEIEHRLRSHPDVRDVVVLARPDRTGDRKLVAYVVPSGGGGPAVSELRRYAAQTLPDYMVPNVVAFVDAFPATSNGKLDREALPWPVEPGSRHELTAGRLRPAPEPTGGAADDGAGDGGGPGGTVPGVPSAEALATEIAEVFAELLDVSAVDAGADIWDQGATSFTMVQVSGALQQRYGWQVPVSALLLDPTVAGIARAVLAQAAPAGAGPEAAVAERAPEPVTPATVPAAAAATATAAVPASVPVPAPLPCAVEPPAAEPPAGEAPAPGEVDFFDAGEREAFKRARWDLRRPVPGERVLPLDDEPVAEEHFAWRESRREFGTGPVSRQAFGRLLGLLRETVTGGRRRRLYPSAGDTYAVQVYVHVRPGGVEGVPEGLYYHHPVDHVLRVVDPEPRLDRSRHFVYNRPVHDRAAFELYLFGADDAIAPLYGADSERFQLLEAGYLGQLLLLAQPFTGIGLCPVGTVTLDPLRERLGLGPRHRYLHAFFGGPLAAPPAAAGTDGPRPLFVPSVPTVLPVPAVPGAPAAAAPAAATVPVDAAGPGGPAPEVVVVGAAGRFPGADDLDAYWRNLSEGRRSLTGVPDGRAGQFPAAAPPGGYLADVDGFDSLLFRVAPVEAPAMDPQLRLLLHTVQECLDDAGHTARSLAGAGRVGVFLGAMWQDYQHVGADRARAGEPAVISATASEAANRISHAFGWDGPSLAVDTSCSSSLTALHLAAESLRRGECATAVVAAANLLTHPYHLELLTGLGLLAERLPAGAFDTAAAGWSPGEGVAAVLLRTAAAAERDGDTAVAVVEATGVGHSGGDGRFASPQAGRLARSLAATLARAGVAPGEVDYVECAAAGALLADAAEIEALGTVFAGGSVTVGTVKPNVGHLEAAAGMSQLIKVLLQFRHGQIAPTVLTDGAGDSWPAALRPADRLAFWPAAGPGRVLVNAVGATGSLAHAVLRAVPAAPPPAAAGTSVRLVLPLSAPTGEQLAELAGRLNRALVPGRAPEPADVAFTLQSGRPALARRAVVEAVTPAELRAALEALHRGAAPDVPADPALAAWVSGGDLDWTPYRPAGARRVPLPGLPSRPVRHVLEALPKDRAAAAAAGEPTDEDGTTEYLTAVYAEISGVPLDRLDPHTPLDHYGISSAQIVRLSARLSADLGAEVPSTLFFAHRDLAGAAGALAALRRASGAERRAPDLPAPDLPAPGLPAAGRPDVDGPRPVPGTATDAPGDGRIAVVGIAGRYPQAQDLDEFWEHLLAGRDLVTELPPGRRGARGPERATGGFLDDVAGFDPLFFGITPRDAAAMDPQERLFLQTVWHTLEDAGCTRERLRERHGGRVGVFVGSMYNEYPFFGLGGPRPVGSAVAGIANRVSYFLDLNGPSLTVDTMCSASLSALHLAVGALRRGECEAALAGGVNLSLHPNKFATLRTLGMASSDHRCRSFGAGGDGFVPGEGVGAVLLKPLARALADGDRIHAVLLGTAVNHDGRTNGYTVPNPVAQGELVGRALRDAGLRPEDIGYLEAHGTGTPLGDPIELDGLARVFTTGDRPPGHWPIGSLKSNTGHLEAAAGIAGLTKAVLQFRHGTLVPSLHAERLNPNVDWPRSPFRVQREAEPWPADLPRRAGVSAFGAGGSNAHVVLEAYPREVPPPAAGAPADGPQLIVLSARTEERLRLLAGRWRRILAVRPAPLADLAYTAQLGREAMRERLAVVADDPAHLAELLDRYLAGDTGAVVRGRAGTTAGPLAAPGTPPAALARHWADGGAVDWAALHPAPRRIADLPGYPFEAVRCWADDPADDPADSPAGGPGSGDPGAGEPVRPPLPSPGPLPVVPAGADTEVPLLARDWCEEPFPAPGPAPAGTVLCLLADDRPVPADGFAPAELVTLRQGTDFRDASGAVAAVRGLLARGPVDGVLDLCALGEGPEQEHDAGPWTARLAILQEVLAARPAGGVRILQVTSGLSALPGVRPNPAGSRLAGFVRPLGAEYPTARATVLDTDRPDLLPELLDVWRDSGPYGELCLRAGRRHRPVLVPVGADPAPWRPDPDRVYLVTGGTRGLGALTARHLVGRGARRLAVLGLRPLPPRHSWGGGLTGPDAEAVANIRELERLGARVMTHTGPLTGRDGLAGFLDAVRTALGPLGGVVHCAGRSSTGPAPLIRKDLADVRAVLEPKGDGLDTLLELTAADPLDFVLLFSSVSAALPALAAGVADYAAANARLDAVARHRPGTRAVNWPVWRDTGGGTGHPGAAARAGLEALPDAAGLAVLDRVLGLPAGVYLPCPAGAGGFDAATALHVDRPGPAPTGTANGTTAAAPVGTVTAVATAGAGAPPSAEPWLVGLFASALRIPEADLDVEATFGDLGVESVLLAELVTAIETATGRPLSPTALFDHPTIGRLDAHLRAAGATGRSPLPLPLPLPSPSPSPSAEPAAPQSASAPQPAVPAEHPGTPDGRIAVIGLACRFPGAPDQDAFWRLLRAGDCAVTEVPAGRWDVERLYRPERLAGHSISKWGGFLDGLEDFDPDFFGLTDAGARDLDPAIRLALEGAAACLRDAGYQEEEVRGTDTGVFMGARMSGYRHRIGLDGAATGLGGDQNFIAARLSHQYDLRGPALVVDSACSSALVAVQTAIRSLLAGESELALAGGVEVLLDEEPYLEFSHARALSPRGRCAAFDRDADGFVPGEGCGMLLLKPLAAALRDGDRVHAVIDAVAVGNDGRTMGLTTPNPAAQGQVVRRALAVAGVRADQVGLLEAHGTGTLIGDPIELRALTDVFREQTDRSGYCAIGSVKSNLGHLLSAAGIAGLLKALLAVEHGEIPPTLFCDTPNPRFDFAASPFTPATRREWTGPRIAGVSAFGLGGTNAHAVVSGAPASLPRRSPLPPPVFRRRRLWRERAAVPAPVPAPATGNTGIAAAPEAVPAAPAAVPLVASLLDLDFHANGKARA